MEHQDMTYNSNEFTQLDPLEIEREARAMQARALAEMFGALRRAITARLTRANAAQST
tara:strand:+ start:15830 stop:16003 length:174 start_codon:yes stop_codon:yes gene_type:complete